MDEKGNKMTITETENLSPLDEEDKLLTKEEHMVNYIKTMIEIDKATEPFREHARDLKRSYVENSWLRRDEMSLALKAYRMLRSDDDIEKIWEYIEALKKNLSL